MLNANQTGAFGLLFGLARGIVLVLPASVNCAGTDVDTGLTRWYLVYVGYVILVSSIPGYGILKSLTLTYAVFFAAGICRAVFAGYLHPGMVKIASFLFIYTGLWSTYIPTGVTINGVYEGGNVDDEVKTYN